MPDQPLKLQAAPSSEEKRREENGMQKKEGTVLERKVVIYAVVHDLR